MKSTVSNKPCDKEKPFPKLMQSTVTGLIVLCSSETCGTVVANPITSNPLGMVLTGIVPEYWKDFEGSVWLENGD